MQRIGYKSGHLQYFHLNSNSLSICVSFQTCAITLHCVTTSWNSIQPHSNTSLRSSRSPGKWKTHNYLHAFNLSLCIDTQLRLVDVQCREHIGTMKKVTSTIWSILLLSVAASRHYSHRSVKAATERRRRLRSYVEQWLSSYVPMCSLHCVHYHHSVWRPTLSSKCKLTKVRD